MTEWKWIKQNTRKPTRWADLATGKVDGKIHSIEWEVAAEGSSQYSGQVRIDGVTMSRTDAIKRYFSNRSADPR